MKFRKVRPMVGNYMWVMILKWPSTSEFYHKGSFLHAVRRNMCAGFCVNHALWCQIRRFLSLSSWPKFLTNGTLKPKCLTFCTFHSMCSVRISSHDEHTDDDSFSIGLTGAQTCNFLTFFPAPPRRRTAVRTSVQHILKWHL